jgi:hypothetical protein
MKGSRPNALAPRAIAETTLEARAEPVGEPLRAPASGAPCVHWRLRIFEHVAHGMEFVHEVVSPEPIDLVWRREPERPPVRIRLAPESARLQAQPVLFRPGTPGALSVARQFGLAGVVRVEEVIVRAGESVEAVGVLADPAAALSRGPFRTIDAPLELLGATLRLETGLGLRPVMLPWVLGTAAALLGSMGAATALLHRWGGHIKRVTGPSAPIEIGARKPLRLQWP